MVVAGHLVEGGVRGVDPSSPLVHELNDGLGGVGRGQGVGDIGQLVIVVFQSVDGEAEDPVLRQVHVLLIYGLGLVGRVQNQLQVFLDNVLLFRRLLAERLVAVGRPRPGQHLQEAEVALEVFVQDVRVVVLELLGVYQGDCFEQLVPRVNESVLEFVD